MASRKRVPEDEGHPAAEAGLPAPAGATDVPGTPGGGAYISKTTLMHVQAWSSSTSLIINRHPFARLVSLYVAWDAMSDPEHAKSYRVVERFRSAWEKRANQSPRASPQEFLQ